MKIIYHDFGGTHSSATAAALHLRLVGEDTPPTSKELVSRVPYFDRVPNTMPGIVIQVGYDPLGNSVCILGRRGVRQIATNLMLSIAAILGHREGELMLVDVSPCVNPIMRIGGYLSRRLGLIALGRPIVSFGTRLAFGSIVSLVERVKDEIGMEIPE